MPPKFSLQNVLDIRHGKVELLEIELGKMISVYQKTLDLLSSLQVEQATLLERLNTAQSGEFDLFNISAIRANILHIHKRIEGVTLELVRQKQQVDEKRIDLVRAKQDEETLEILKKKRYETFMAEQAQIEARAQDDIYIAQAFRNQQQGA